MYLLKLFGWNSNSKPIQQTNSTKPAACLNTRENKPNVIEYNKNDNYFTFISSSLSGMYQTYQLISYLVDHIIDKLTQNLYSKDSVKDYKSNLITWANDFITHLKLFDSAYILPLNVYNSSSVTLQRIWYSPDCSCIGDLVVFRHTTPAPKK